VNTDYGPATALALAACLLAAFGLITWILSAPVDGYMTPALGYVVGGAIGALAPHLYRVLRGRS
jgi:hypothetical protein